MQQNERQPGYYRVRNDEWEIALWNGKHWEFAGLESCFINNDSDLKEIDETPIDPRPSNYQKYSDEILEATRKSLGLTIEQINAPMPDIDSEIKERYRKLRKAMDDCGIATFKAYNIAFPTIAPIKEILLPAKHTVKRG